MRPSSASEILDTWDDQNINNAFEGEINVIIYLDDIESSNELSAQLAHFGFEPTVITCYHELISAVKSPHTKAIIISTELAEGRGSQQLKSLQVNELRIPVIYIADNNDIETQLEAVNNGGIAFFQKPFEIPSILDKLEQITKRTPESPYRILIVDDSESVATYNATILQSVGMQTEIINNPFEVLSPLIDFDPDLILLDMYMPQCTGAELAKIIRLNDAYNSIPIVFLSMEDDLEKQIATIKLGADDFLNKTINAKHLITSISARVKRARKLRSLMIRDSLTNLLNHSSIKKQLNNEVKRSERTGENFCFAMIDIDHFKNINDSYGHSSGDRVIKQLARLLKQRLRTTDIIGRYGGEEFAVIMPDTPIEYAYSVMDELRKTYSEIIHHYNQSTFQSTFSCGIADFVSCPNATLINDTADNMLYDSKSKGRNRITVYKHDKY